jgi:DNA-binding FadR family transcriptional regulator
VNRPDGAAVTDPRFQKIARQRISDRVAEEIMWLIASGRFAPGERLPGERQLAEMMRASRVSVRAALQQLKAQGLLAAVQGGGTRILSSARALDQPLSRLVRLDRNNLQDLAEIRAILEVWAARRAARQATPEQITEIERRLELMARPERQGLVRAGDDVGFHFAIAKAAGSAVYCHVLSVVRDTLYAMLEYHRYELFETPDDDWEVYGQHRAILEAIGAGDPEAAAAAMDRHLRWVLDHYRAGQRRHDAVPRAAAQ